MSALSTVSRRTAILEAALSCFLEFGYSATTIEQIRKRSGATTGSIYHFFAGKGALAEALLRDAVAGWSAAGAGPDASAEDAVKASVRGLLQWALANPRLFRFMDEIRLLPDTDPGLAAVKEMLATGQSDAAALYRRFARAREVRPLPWPVAYSLMLGPAYSYLRMKRSSRDSAKTAVALLTAAAWDAVRAS